MDNATISRSNEEPKSLAGALLARLRGLFSEVSIHRRPRRLKVCETVSLGDKRIVALIEYENQRFLVAATAENISLLQTLSIPKEGDQTPEQS